jgi:hypothetical protein
MDENDMKASAKAGAIFGLAGQLVAAEISAGYSLANKTKASNEVAVDFAIKIAEMLWEKSGMQKALDRTL